MHVLRGVGVSEAFAAACRAILEHGSEVAPRGLATLELSPVTVVIEQPRQRLLEVPGRVVNPAFAAAEALWILRGSAAPWIFEYNRRLEAFTDDGELKGAYGPRLRRWQEDFDQLDHVRRKLLADPSSRQAVLQIWDPQRDTQAHRDVSCTLSHRFLVRQGQLHLFTTMRSQDLWWGLPYDLFSSTLLHELMAGWLDLEIGTCHHTVDSLHLYERSLAAARRVEPPPPLPSRTLPPCRVPWEQLDTVIDATLVDPQAVEGGWRDFARVLASYRHWQRGERAEARSMARCCDGPWCRALLRWYERLAEGPPILRVPTPDESSG